VAGIVLGRKAPSSVKDSSEVFVIVGYSTFRDSTACHTFSPNGDRSGAEPRLDCLAHGRPSYPDEPRSAGCVSTRLHLEFVTESPQQTRNRPERFSAPPVLITGRKADCRPWCGGDLRHADGLRTLHAASQALATPVERPVWPRPCAPEWSKCWAIRAARPNASMKPAAA